MTKYKADQRFQRVRRHLLGRVTGLSPEAVFWVGGVMLPESGRGHGLFYELIAGSGTD